jgi:hypothetical protein
VRCRRAKAGTNERATFDLEPRWNGTGASPWRDAVSVVESCGSECAVGRRADSHLPASRTPGQPSPRSRRQRWPEPARNDGAPARDGVFDFADEAGVVVRALTRTSGRALGGALACPGQGVFAEVVVGHAVAYPPPASRPEGRPNVFERFACSLKNAPKVLASPPTRARKGPEGSFRAADGLKATLGRFARARRGFDPNHPKVGSCPPTLRTQPSNDARPCENARSRTFWPFERPRKASSSNLRTVLAPPEGSLPQPSIGVAPSPKAASPNLRRRRAHYRARMRSTWAGRR